MKQGSEESALEGPSGMPNDLGDGLFASRAYHFGERAVRQGIEVVDVELVKQAARGDLSRIHVSRSTHDCVIGGQHTVEEILVDVVESGARLADPALGDKRPEEQCELLFLFGERLVCWP